MGPLSIADIIAFVLVEGELDQERYADIVLDQAEPVMVAIAQQVAAGGSGD